MTRARLAKGDAVTARHADSKREEGLAHGGLWVAREHEAREPEREEGSVLYDGVHVRVREEVLNPGGVVRLLAGAPI